MKQVQIWIEECPFDRTIIFATEYTHWEDVVEINRIIEERSWRFDTECAFLKLKPNESRETILEALEKYQKSKLPKGWYIRTYKWDYLKTIIDPNSKLHIADFYDPETRVITITDFREEPCT